MLIPNLSNDNLTVLTSGLASRAARRLAPSLDWSDMSGTDHFVQFYDADKHIIDSVTEYFVHGIRSGESCLLVATPEHREAISKAIRAFEPNLESHIAKGRLVSLDAAETISSLMTNGRLNAGHFDRIVGGLIGDLAKRAPRVRVFGEMVALLIADGKPAVAAEFEEMWNDLGLRERFLLFCAYPSTAFDSPEAAASAAAICSSHSHVIPDETYTSLGDPGERLRFIARLQQRTRQLEAELAVLEASIAAKHQATM